MAEISTYRSESEIAEVVRRFESCDYRPEEFVHARHLTVAAWYLLNLDEWTATQRMRDGLMRFTAYHLKSGYHETITLFWLRAIALHVAVLRGAEDSVTIVNRIVAELSDKNLISRHYSRDAIASPAARLSWTDPDLAPLPVQS